MFQSELLWQVMTNIFPYEKALKPYARELRTNMTIHERILWERIRKKKIQNVQFYRQKIIGTYILDFYAKDPKLCIELDGLQHSSLEHMENDKTRDKYLNWLGIFVLRFDNSRIIDQLDVVLLQIEKIVLELRR